MLALIGLFAFGPAITLSPLFYQPIERIESSKSSYNFRRRLMLFAFQLLSSFHASFRYAIVMVDPNKHPGLCWATDAFFHGFESLTPGNQSAPGSLLMTAVLTASVKSSYPILRRIDQARAPQCSITTDSGEIDRMSVVSLSYTRSYLPNGSFKPHYLELLLKWFGSMWTKD